MPKADVHVRDKNGCSLLMLAAQSGNTAVIQVCCLLMPRAALAGVSKGEAKMHPKAVIFHIHKCSDHSVHLKHVSCDDSMTFSNASFVEHAKYVAFRYRNNT